MDMSFTMFKNLSVIDSIRLHLILEVLLDIRDLELKSRGNVKI